MAELIARLWLGVLGAFMFPVVIWGTQAMLTLTEDWAKSKAGFVTGFAALLVYLCWRLAYEGLPERARSNMLERRN